jgi:peptidyl-prolyl cis-trans isomerase A (cyclophilin A)
MKTGSVRFGWYAMVSAIVAGVAPMLAAAEGGAEAQGEKKATNVTVAAENAKVVIETSLGTIKAELWADKAPGTVSNFLAYVEDKFYDGVIFHRVIKGFMIQAGAFLPDMRQKRPTYPAIINEGRKDVKNQRGTLSMARGNHPDSATCQFFINHVDNGQLDQLVYCVFGKVTEGMDIVDAIAQVPAANMGPFEMVPKEPVVIKSVRREQATAAPAAK